MAHKDGHAVQLSLTRVSRDDSGRYTLTASNSSGESRAGYDLRVDSRMSMSDSLSVPTHDDAPHFLRSLADLAVKVGTRTRFLVEIRSPSDLKVGHRTLMFVYLLLRPSPGSYQHISTYCF